MLATWGVVNPTILLPAAAQGGPTIASTLFFITSWRVLRGDWVVALTANLLQDLYWFNPVLWIASRRLRHEAERACDDLVLTSGISGSGAAHLIDVRARPRSADIRGPRQSPSPITRCSKGGSCHAHRACQS